MRTAIKPEKLGALIKKVDEQVSLYVRLNAADDRGTVKCVSCSERLWWADSDCAHFKDRGNMATRFYLPNLAPACQDCNRFNHYEHIQRWGLTMKKKALVDLNLKAHSMEKFTRPELEEKLQEFTDKVKELRRKKGL
jgi:hypothetical protein